MPESLASPSVLLHDLILKYSWLVMCKTPMVSKAHEEANSFWYGSLLSFGSAVQANRSHGVKDWPVGGLMVFDDVRGRILDALCSSAA